jgi:hypothetical protein
MNSLKLKTPAVHSNTRLNAIFGKQKKRGFLVPSPEKFFLSSDDLINQIQQRQHITMQFLELHKCSDAWGETG